MCIVPNLISNICLLFISKTFQHFDEIYFYFKFLKLFNYPINQHTQLNQKSENYFYYIKKQTFFIINYYF